MIGFQAVMDGLLLLISVQHLIEINHLPPPTSWTFTLFNNKKKCVKWWTSIHNILSSSSWKRKEEKPTTTTAEDKESKRKSWRFQLYLCRCWIMGKSLITRSSPLFIHPAREWIIQKWCKCQVIETKRKREKSPKKNQPITKKNEQINKYKKHE